MLKIPIEEAVAKIRSGPPIDAEKDYDSNIWAGVINIGTVLGEIENCPRLDDSVQTPEHVRKFVEQERLFK